MTDTLDEPFFTADGDRYLPTVNARGPWNGGNSLHGRAVIGLLGHELERLHGGPDYLPARLTVDLFRLAPVGEVRIVTRPIRDGYRIKVIEAEFVVDGQSCARAVCQFLRRQAPSAPPPWTTPRWDVPRPEDIAPPTGLNATWNARWALRPVVGFESDGPRKIWMSEIREMVGGRPHTPFGRLTAAVDITSPVATGNATGLPYINSDLTLYLHREPKGEWMGFEAIAQGAADGLAAGACIVHDVEGPIGFSACSGLGQKEHATRKPPAPDSGA